MIYSTENENKDFSVYDNMSIEEMDEILFQEETDTERILYILKVIAEREKVDSEWDTDTAWKDFQTNYLPITEKRLKRSHRFGYVYAALALAFCFIMIGSITAQAMGFNVWERVAKWADGVFRFEYTKTQPEETFPLIDGQDAEEPDIQYGSLQEALDAKGITEKLAPSWIPEDYELVEVSVTSTAKKTLYDAVYFNGEKFFGVSISAWNEPDSLYIEVDEDVSIREYTVEGITHYFMTNQSEHKVAWSNGIYECLIYGELDEPDLEKMIDSIYQNR